ncbi:MAG: GNAT family N-acetyltransferase [Pseudomonadota bacterium]
MADTQDVTLSLLSADAAEARLNDLAALMHSCVRAGASINFILPFEMPESVAFWRASVMPPLVTGTRKIWIAELGERLVGSVQLDIGTPPNQPHRAEVTKLMVHPDARRRGIARLLMAELEREVAALGRTLITLDTRTGDSAEPLYTSLGYKTLGVLPGYCIDPVDRSMDDATFMFKTLGASQPA